MIVRDTCMVFSVDLGGEAGPAYVAISDQFLKDGRLAREIDKMLDPVATYAKAFGNDQEHAVKNLRDKLSTGGKF
jgi:hypothetical protein